MLAHETTKGKEKGMEIVQHEELEAPIPMTKPTTVSSNQRYVDIDGLKSKVLYV